MKSILEAHQILRRKKIEISKALTLSKLMYGLQSLWLTKRQRAEMHGFYCKCIRSILGIAHPYFSRVIKKHVLREAGCVPFDKLLLQYQLLFFGHLARNFQHPAPPIEIVRLQVHNTPALMCYQPRTSCKKDL